MAWAICGGDYSCFVRVFFIIDTFDLVFVLMCYFGCFSLHLVLKGKTHYR